jgi:hypothetical protein
MANRVRKNSFMILICVTNGTYDILVLFFSLERIADVSEYCIAFSNNTCRKALILRKIHVSASRYIYATQLCYSF